MEQCRAQLPELCHSLGPQDDGQLVLRDRDGAALWGSATSDTTLTQLIAPASRANLACISSGPDPAAITLHARDGSE